MNYIRGIANFNQKDRYMLFCRRDLFQEKWNSAAFALRHSEKCLL